MQLVQRKTVVIANTDDLEEASAQRVASTGPRSRERGGRRDEIQPGLSRRASTGPRSRERGGVGGAINEGFIEPASTGPRSRERGGFSVRPCGELCSQPLQRGRAHVSAEGASSQTIPP